MVSLIATNSNGCADCNEHRLLHWFFVPVLHALFTCGTHTYQHCNSCGLTCARCACLLALQLHNTQALLTWCLSLSGFKLYWYSQGFCLRRACLSALRLHNTQALVRPGAWACKVLNRTDTLRVFAIGVPAYLRSNWNKLDLVVTSLSIVNVLVEYLVRTFLRMRVCENLVRTFLRMRVCEYLVRIF